MARSRRGRGEGGIFQRASDGRWVGTVSQGYDATGKRVRQTVYGDSKRDVQAKLAALKTTPDAPRELERLTVAAYLTRWLELVKPTVEHGTYRPYASHIDRHITPIIGTLKLIALKRFHVEELYEKLAAKSVSAAMQRKIGTTLTIALGAAVDKEMIPFNPAARVRKPKAARPDIHPLDGARAQAFLAATETDRLHALYVVALDSGARPGELFALTWADVDFGRASITIAKSLAANAAGKLAVKDVKTKRGRRTIRLAPSTVDALHEHRKRMLAEGHAAAPVFCTTAGTYLHLTDVHRHGFKPALVRAKLPDIRIYDLRHTCATLLLGSGENIKVVSERLGHSSVVITLDTYAHVMEGMQEQAATKMQGILHNKKA